VSVVHGTALAGLREGFEYMRRTTHVRVLMAAVLVFAVFGTPYLTLMPVVARDRLGLGAGGYGVLLAAVGVGGFAGALYVAAFSQRLSRRRLLVGASFAYAVLLLCFAVVRSPLVARVMLLGIGFTMILHGALSNGILQSRVPDVLRGRLMAAYSFAVVGMAQVVGSFLGGAVARAAGVAWAIGGGAGIMLLYGSWTYWHHRGVWRPAVAAPIAVASES
jgi:predicted MFS family arabinose efflux permease